MSKANSNNKIKMIFNDEYQYSQWYSTDWRCGLEDINGDDIDVPITLVMEVTDMYEATGEDEYKDYGYIISIGLLNLNIHQTIKDQVTDHSDDYSLYDIISYYGLNCYIEDQLFNTDTINSNHYKNLNIEDACFSEYRCRFTGKTKKYLKFKDYKTAFIYGQLLIESYAPALMTLIGFTLDRPINLIGETGWKQTENLHFGL